MKLKVLAILLFIGIIALIAWSQKKNEPFAQAKDFPRDALVYAQMADLPAFIKLWNESKLKEKYLPTQNFKDFKNSHLGIKLASRWEEFNQAAGFPIDLETVSGLAQNRAALAVYDIGKLEFVFIAPVNDEIFNATKFFQNQANFEELTLEDGTVFYSCDVEADRGRQKQKLLFANLKGRLVLATSEKLLLRTLTNISGKSKKDRLVDEPLFNNLSEKIAPHVATVWVNQTALNKDYYFKQYWLANNLEDLKNIRAGIFDFEIREKELVERREVLLDEAAPHAKISAEKATQILSVFPENIPFYRLQSAINAKNTASLIGEALFDRRIETETGSSKRHSNRYYTYDFDDSDWHDYSWLNEKYEQAVNENDEEETIDVKRDSNFEENIEQSLQVADPQTILTATRPQMLPEPLFAEFNRVAVVKLGAPENLNKPALENAIAEELKSRLMISAPNIDLKWETKTESGLVRRELNLPSLGWGVGYALRENDLIFSNNSQFLQEILALKNKGRKTETPFNDLTVIRIERRKEAFDDIMEKIYQKSEGRERVSIDFFRGNISSLLDAISDVRQIEIKRDYSENYLHEEIKFVLSDRQSK